MTEKKEKQAQENFFLPEPVRELLAEIYEKHPKWKKRKWRMWVAAILDLVSAGDAEMTSRIGRIASAEMNETDGISKLVDEARREATKTDVIVNAATLPIQATEQQIATPPKRQQPGGAGAFGRAGGRSKK